MKFSENTNISRALLLIVFLAIFVRLFQLNLPFIEPYNSHTRQSIVAAVAQNFYQRGYQFFNPEINENGRGPYLYNAEMPFCSFLMALGYGVTGGAHPWVARLVSVLFSLGGLLYLWLLVRHLYGQRCAIPALAFAAFTPLNLALSRSLQPEAMFLCASLGALYHFALYQETRQSQSYAASLIWMFLAVGTKITNLYLFIPLFYLAWKSQKKAVFTDPWNYLYVAVACLPLIWYAHMWDLGQRFDLAYEPYNLSTKNKATHGVPYWQVLLAWKSWWILGTVFFVHLLTPIGWALLPSGIWSAARQKNNGFLCLWVISVLVQVLVLFRGYLTHPYYQLPLVPVCAILIGKGFEAVEKSLMGKIFLKNGWLVGAIAFLEILFLSHFYHGLYFIPKEHRRVVQIGLKAQTLLPKDALVVADFDGASPIQLTYCNRRGWTYDIRGKSCEEIENDLKMLKAKGAEFIVTARSELMKSCLDLEGPTNRFKVRFQGPEGLILDT